MATFSVIPCESWHDFKADKLPALFEGKPFHFDRFLFRGQGRFDWHLESTFDRWFKGKGERHEKLAVCQRLLDLFRQEGKESKSSVRFGTIRIDFSRWRNIMACRRACSIGARAHTSPRSLLIRISRLRTENPRLPSGVWTDRKKMSGLKSRAWKLSMFQPMATTDFGTRWDGLLT
jgi:hypothetical protein